MISVGKANGDLKSLNVHEIMKGIDMVALDGFFAFMQTMHQAVVYEPPNPNWFVNLIKS
jgi:hypothetical protein